MLFWILSITQLFVIWTHWNRFISSRCAEKEVYAPTAHFRAGHRKLHLFSLKTPILGRFHQRKVTVPCASSMRKGLKSQPTPNSYTKNLIDNGDNIMHTHANQKHRNRNRTIHSCWRGVEASQQRMLPHWHKLAYMGGANQFITQLQQLQQHSSSFSSSGMSIATSGTFRLPFW